MQLKVGDRVKIIFPSSDLTGVNTVLQFQNKVTVIKNIRTFYNGKSSLGRTFILEGCKSESGLDYEFIEEWLVPMDEEVVV